MNLIALEAQSARAVIVPEAGCQCLSYRVGPIEIISAPSDPEEFKMHPHRGGIPILFPWPGRIAGGRFSFGGREYRVPINEPARGHALHGFVCERPFEVARRGPYFLSARYDTAGDELASERWPWPFILTMDYELGLGLRISATVENSGRSAMPFGFGAHPYFRAPLGPDGSRENAEIRVDAESRWPLDADLIPSGAPVPLDGKFDLRRERKLGIESYDDVFHILPAGDPEAARARLVDRQARVAVEVRADPAFREFLIYGSPSDPFVAIEPYTCAPDAFNLDARGIDAGTRVLAPGESFTAHFEIRVTGARQVSTIGPISR
jgi:aldose 1-epimerase